MLVTQTVRTFFSLCQPSSNILVEHSRNQIERIKGIYTHIYYWTLNTRSNLITNILFLFSSNLIFKENKDRNMHIQVWKCLYVSYDICLTIKFLLIISSYVSNWSQNAGGIFLHISSIITDNTHCTSFNLISLLTNYLFQRIERISG